MQELRKSMEDEIRSSSSKDTKEAKESQASSLAQPGKGKASI